MSNGNPAATNEPKTLKAEQQTEENPEEEGKHLVKVQTPQGDSPVEDCTTHTFKQEGEPPEGHLETPEKVKKEDQKMENDPETSDSSSVKGRCHLF